MTQKEEMLGHLQFRLAVEEDYPAICRLVTSEEELFFMYPQGYFPFDVQQLHVLAEQRYELTVATVRETVVGFTNFYGLEEKHQAFIGNVIIEKTLRSCGIGRVMIGEMLKLGFEKYGLQKVNISVFSHNIPALLLYSRIGFTPVVLEEQHDFTGQKILMLHMTVPRKTYENETSNRVVRKDI